MKSIFMKLFSIPANIPLRLSYQCLVVRLLYDVALDSYDRGGGHTTNVSYRSPSQAKRHTHQRSVCSPGSGRRSQVSSLNLNPPVPDPVIVHCGVVVAILHLIPSIFMKEYQQVSGLIFSNYFILLSIY